MAEVGCEMFELIRTLTSKSSYSKSNVIVRTYEMEVAEEHDPWSGATVTSQKNTCFSAIEKYVAHVVQICVNAQSTDYSTFPVDHPDYPSFLSGDINERISREKNMRARLVYKSDPSYNYKCNN